MARFSNGIYFLFAVLVVLAVFANALPAKGPSDMAADMGQMGSVAGVPGLSAVMPKKQQQKEPDIDDDFMVGLAEALTLVPCPNPG